MSESEIEVRAEAARILAHFGKMVRRADRSVLRYAKKDGYATKVNNLRILRDEYQERVDTLTLFLLRREVANE